MSAGTEESKSRLSLLQIGIVTKDIERTLMYFKKLFDLTPYSYGIWPPEGRNDIKRYYNGESSEFTVKLAFIDMCNIELEIIQPVSGDSVYSDFLKKRGEGLHHIRFNVPDSEVFINHMKENGADVTQWGVGLRPGTRWTYFDTEDTLGFVIEAINNLQGSDGKTPDLYEMVCKREDR